MKTRLHPSTPTETVRGGLSNQQVAWEHFGNKTGTTTPSTRSSTHGTLIRRRVQEMMRDILRCTGVIGILSYAVADISSAPQLPPHVAAQVAGACETPVSQRTSDSGCYLVATERLERLPAGPLFWHL